MSLYDPFHQMQQAMAQQSYWAQQSYYTTGYSGSTLTVSGHLDHGSTVESRPPKKPSGPLSGDNVRWLRGRVDEMRVTLQ